MIHRAVAIGLTSFIVLSIIVAGIPIQHIDTSSHTQVVLSENGSLTITIHQASEAEIIGMKSRIGTFDPVKNYNVLHAGHGTGLCPPTTQEWESMVGAISIVEEVTPTAPLTLSPIIDLSTDPCFPKVGDQRSQGSCSAWSAAYYANGYVQAKQHNWTEASVGNLDHLLSPAFTYNKCNKGRDKGSSLIANGEVMQSVGVCRWSQMPYNHSDNVSWGDEHAWRDAPEYRISTIQCLNYPYNPDDIDTIKTLISQGIPVTFAINSDSYTNFGSDDVLGLHDMYYGYDHSQAIVGYDDSKVDGDSGETGAFKIVNSWGKYWGPNYDGYYWLTYDAFIGPWNEYWVCWFEDLYTATGPSLLGVFELDPTCDRDASLELCIGSYGSPEDNRTPIWDGHSKVMHPYPSFMCLDISEFSNEWTAGTHDFYLAIGDAASVDGTITSFQVEYYYNSYDPMDPDLISYKSPDTPQGTPGYVTVSFLQPTQVYINTTYDNSTLGYGYDRFNTIQDGINAIASYGTVMVDSGTYYEHLRIDKPLHLLSENHVTTSIMGSGNADVIKIFTEDVTLEGFFIQNNRSVYPAHSYSAISIWSDANHIRGNKISNCIRGITLSQFAEDNVIEENLFVDNTCGLYLYVFANSNEITGNSLRANDIGIWLVQLCSDNTISENTIENSSEIGIRLENSSDNRIYHNKFRNNTQDAFDNGVNTWHHNTLHEGNYWAAYLGTDRDGDGRGDIPHPIFGGLNQDLFPLGLFHPIAEFTVVPTSPTTQDVVNFQDISVDPDGKILLWLWNFGDGNRSMDQNPSHTYSEDGFYTVILTVSDNNGDENTTVSLVEIRNVPPVVNFTFSPRIPEVEENIQFIDGSTDVDGVVTSWQWSFGDGNSSTAQNPHYSYSRFQTYQVVLTAIDNDADSNEHIAEIITKIIYRKEIFSDTERFDCINESDTIFTFNPGTAGNRTNITIEHFSGNPTSQNLPSNGTPLNNYINVSIENESIITWPINITMYYTQDDLDQAGLIETQLVGIYFWNETSMEWQRYAHSGINTSYNKSGYAGYVWAQVPHLTLLVPGGIKNQPPRVWITSPDDSDRVARTVHITGSAFDPDGDEQLQYVRIRIDSSPWNDATGTTTWSYNWDTTRVSDGQHSITAHAYDGKNYSNPVQIQVTVKNKDDSPPQTYTRDPEDDEDGNTPPTADAGGPYSGFVGMPVLFQSSGSTDDSMIVSYKWLFGDDTSSTDITPSHTYSTIGNYTITLKVTDDDGVTDEDTTYTLITEEPNYPPSKPVIQGTQGGTKYTEYNYVTRSTDRDNDSIKYIIEWGDSSNTTSHSIENGTPFITSHTWTNPGVYTILVYAEDDSNATSSFAELNVLIDAEFCNSIGYLVDINSNGIYDLFYSNETRQNTSVSYTDGKYLIDDDGDGTWDYEFTTSSGLKNYHHSKAVQSSEIPVLFVLIVLIVFEIIAIIFVLVKKGKLQK